MKVLLVNGSPHKNGCTNVALEEIAKTQNQEKNKNRLPAAQSPNIISNA